MLNKTLVTLTMNNIILKVKHSQRISATSSFIKTEAQSSSAQDDDDAAKLWCYCMSLVLVIW